MTVRRTAPGFLLLLALAVPGTAAAHATLVRTIPANGAVLAQAPAGIRLLFDDGVRPLGGAVAIRNGGGSVLAGKPRLERGSRHVVVVPLRRALPVGDYSVRWRVVSDDGHVLQGVLAFGVGLGRAPPVPALAVEGTRPSWRTVTSRWLLFAGLLVAAGTAAFGLATRAELAPADEAAGLRVSGIVCVGCALFVGGASSVAHQTSWDTRFGMTYGVGLVLAIVAATLSAIALVETRVRIAAWALALALVPIPSVAGHALDAGRPWPNVVFDAVHVGAAAAWIGALVGLVAVVPAAARAAEVERGRIWSGAGTRASSLAFGGVAMLSATGVFRAFWELASPSQLVSTGYGRSLLVKTALLLSLVAIGWINRERLVPLLADDGPLVARLRRNVGVELGLLALLVGAVAVLTASRPGVDLETVAAPRATAVAAPAPPPPSGAVAIATRVGRLAVGLALEPRRSTLTVIRPDGSGAAGLAVSIGGRTAQPCGPGCYTVHAPPSRRLDVSVGRSHLAFDVPPRPPSATALLRRSTAAFRRLRTVVYRETLSSGLGSRLETLWQVQAPDRLRYDILGRGSAVVVGGVRWDRDGNGPWRRSPASRLTVPAPTWTSAAQVRDVRLLERGAGTLRVAFLDPGLPAWFDVVLDSRTLLPRTLRMTAASHFMRQRFLAYNRPLKIRPPR